MLPPRQSQAVMPYLPRLYDSPPDVHRRVLHELRWLNDLSDMSDEARVALQFPGPGSFFDDVVDVLKHGHHDQSSHGNWAHGPTINWDRDAKVQERPESSESLVERLMIKTGLLDSRTAKAHVAKTLTRRVDEHMTDADWEEYLSTQTMEPANLMQDRVPALPIWSGENATPYRWISMRKTGEMFLYEERPALQSAEDRIERIGSESARDLIKEFCVSKAVEAWAASSNKSPTSQTMQKAVQSAFGLENALDNANRKEARPLKFHIELARAQYEETQELLSSAGVNAVKLYRGTTNRSGLLPIPDSLGGTVKSQLSPLSSWSTDEDIADRFSGRGPIAEAFFPRQRIFSTPFSGFGCLKESEFVILGDVYDVAVLP